MKNKKNFISNHRHIIQGAILHALIGWVVIALGYNSYKKYIQIVHEYFFLTRAVKDSIQAIFPWVVLTFTGLSFIFLAKEKNRKLFLSIHQYVYVIIIYTVLLNIVYFTAGGNITIPINISSLYLGICLLTWAVLRIAKDNMGNWLPPAIADYVNNSQQKIYNRKVSSTFFIVVFMGLFAICSFLLLLNFEKAAEKTADIAYFSLVIGVGMKIYEAIQYEDDEE